MKFLTVKQKNESNNLLNDKLNTSTFNTQIVLKANVSNVYNKTDLYTKADANDLQNLKY